MALESYFSDVRSKLAGFLQCVLVQPKHWYGPMLEEDNPHSLCKLLGLSVEERNVVFIAAKFARKYGSKGDCRFEHDKFAQFLQQCKGINAVESDKHKLKGMSKVHSVFVIGAASEDERVSTFPLQVEAKVLPPAVDESNPHRVALKALAKKLVKIATQESNNNASGDNNGTTTTSGATASNVARAASSASTSNDGNATLYSPISTSCGKHVAAIANPSSNGQSNKQESNLLSTKRSLDSEFSTDESRPTKKRPPQSSWKRKAMAECTTLVVCQGIQDPKLKENGLALHPQSLHELLQRFNYIGGRFCHKECCGLFEPTSQNDESCSLCLGASHSIRADRIPALFKRPSTVAAIAQSNQMIVGAIENAANGFETVESFQESPAAVEFATLLRLYNRESLEFSHNSSLYMLRSCTDCSCAVIKPNRSKKRDADEAMAPCLCDSCKSAERNCRRRESNYKEEQKDASSHTTFANLLLSPNKTRLVARLSGRKKQVKSRDKRIKRLEKTIHRLTSVDNEVKSKLPEVKAGENPGAIRGIVSRLLEAIEADNKGEEATTRQNARDELILGMLNSSLDKQQEANPYTMDDAKRFAAGIREEIEKYGKRLEGKDKQIRFSPKVFQVAMKIWMRSPAAYEDLRKAGWVVSMPSQTTLRRLRNETMVSEGECIALYRRFAESRPRQKLVGFISCDEMKLVEGVCWNTKSHMAYGFAGDFNSLDSVIRGILTGSTDKQPAVEVNQWKYRALNAAGVSFECEFFYNGGNLSNADIRRQQLHVTTCLELINCQVVGASADGASKNVTAMRLQSEAMSSTLPKSQGWLELKYISMVHPFDSERRFYFWLCSTHQEKSMRNQFWTGRDTGKRSFISEDGYNIRWDLLMEQLKRDEASGAPVTKLRKDVLLLDGWAKMNVAFAKAPFHDETLAEALSHICSIASIKIPLGDERAYENDPSCCRPVIVNGSERPKYRRLLGMFSARLAKAKAEIIKKKDSYSEAMFRSIMDEVATLEYQAIIHDIFIEIFMNRNLHFCRENVRELKEYIKSKMTYFTKWHDAMQARRSEKATKEEKAKVALTFISPQTWANIRLTVSGFVEFAEYILESTDAAVVVYVPMLMSNTSNLETTFSHQRSLGGNDARTYATRIACRSVSGSLTAVQNSSSYSVSETLPEDEIEDGRHDPRAIKVFNSDLAAKRKEYLQRFDSRQRTKIPLVCQERVQTIVFQSTSDVATAACTYLSKMSIETHFTEAIARDGFFAEYFLLSEFSNRDALFVKFASLSTTEEEQFNKACQNVVGFFISPVKKMVEVAENYALALEDATIKDRQREVLNAQKAKATGTQANAQEKKTKKQSKTNVKPPEGVFETQSLLFIQGSGMARFMEELPACIGTDRLFAVVIIQSLLRLVRQWSVEALKAAPTETMPKIPGLVSAAANNNFRVVVSVDEDSEVHRFIGSAITTYRKAAKAERKEIEKLKSERVKDSKRPKTSHVRNIRKMEEAILLLDEMGVFRRNIPEQHDKSYDSPMMDALNKGGFRYVSPRYLGWAKELMKKIRASISFDVISANGTSAQSKAYQHLTKDGSLLKRFKGIVSDGKNDIGDAAVEWVFQRVVDFAFHARSDVEWKKYRARKTDRSRGKAKKMGTREFLKAGQQSKIKDE